MTRTITRYDVAGTELGEVDLEPTIFGIEPNEAVLHQVVTAQLAAARSGTQATRTRAEVRGGGAKPYRQKGTGRARQGSTRAPHFAGGGRRARARSPAPTASGPRRRWCGSPSPRPSRTGPPTAGSSWSTAGRGRAPKTKEAVAALEALDLGGRVLAVLSRDDLVADRSFSNLKEVDTVLAGELTAYDVLRSDWIVFTDATLPGGEGAEAGAAEPTGSEDDDA